MHPSTTLSALSLLGAAFGLVTPAALEVGDKGVTTTTTTTIEPDDTPGRGNERRDVQKLVKCIKYQKNEELSTYIPWAKSMHECMELATKENTWTSFSCTSAAVPRDQRGAGWTFHGQGARWDKPSRCYAGCQNCLMSAINDGAGGATCHQRVGFSVCCVGYMPTAMKGSDLDPHDK